MTDMPIFENFTPRDASLWGRHANILKHRLHEHALFSNEALGALIEAYPRERYDLCHMAEPGAKKRFWREGEIGEARGTDVIESIANGRMWINLRDVGAVDARYKALLDTIFDELEGYMPEFRPFRTNLGILISSPEAQAYYHADIPGQSLWQIRGRKRLYVYPTTAPFLSKEAMEKIITQESEEEFHFEEWYDQHARVIDLEPGMMASWALNGPHRVENLGVLNVSVTTEHWTDEIRRSYAAHYGNRVLRRFGFNPQTHALSGPGFWGKAALAAAYKFTPLGKTREISRKVDFRIDRMSPSGLMDIPAYMR
ncbi:MAG: hypothetical protein KDI98_10150 [Hyphomicrobiaceae bacterium]|nr:hypothetical protein [Hyphomicrobiaceae bacterium]